MEKLIELLNEYEKSGLNEFELEKYEEWWYCEWNGRIFRGNWENNNELTPYELCGKQFGFIKRLVENDKIDLEELTAQAQEKIRLNLFGYKDNKELDTDLLLMLLSIQDNPLDFLCSILK